MPPWCASSCAGSIPSRPHRRRPFAARRPAARRHPRPCASSATTPSAGTKLRALHVADREIERARSPTIFQVGARRLLDIGTGTGRLLEVLAPKVEQAIGVDQSREMLALARANLARAGIDNADIRLGDMYALPFEADSFDVVTIHHVLHYADDPAAALSEAARVVRPGGVVLVVDFSPHDLVELKREHAHVHLGFADNQVQGWLRSAGLNPLEPIHFPGRRIMTGIWRGEREIAERPSHTTNLAHERHDEPRHRPAERGKHAGQRVSRALGPAGGASFEFSPPKTEAMERTLWKAVTRLAPLRPDLLLGDLRRRRLDGASAPTTPWCA